MAYQLKDEDVTAPEPDQIDRRSVVADGVAAVVVVLATIGLIVLVLSHVID